MGIKIASLLVEIGADVRTFVDGLRWVDDSMDSTKTKTARFAEGVKEIGSAFSKVSGVATGAAVVFKKAMDFGEQGAAIAQTGESFDFLLETVGAAPDLLKRLSAASKGTISDMKLMSSTSTLLAGAQGELATRLAESTPKLLEIAKAANKLNPTLGDTTFMYESLALGIKRASPMILDNLGLTIKIGDANEKLAKSLGKTVEELTAEEQKMALLQATLEAGDVLINQVGGTTDSAADSFARFNVATEELSGAVKLKLYPALATAAEAAAILLTMHDKMKEATEEHSANVVKSTTRYKDYVKQMLEARVAAGLNTQAQMDLWQQQLNNDKSLEKLVVLYGGLSLEQYKAAKASDAMTNRVKIQAAAMGYASKALAESAEYVRRYAGYSQEGADRIAASVSSYNDVIADLNEQAFSDLQDTINGSLGRSLESFRESQRDLNQEALKLANEIKKLEGVEYLSKDQSTQLDENKAKLKEIQEQIKANADEHDKATKRILFDLLTQRAALDGLTSDELALITTMAEQWGLIDEATASAMKAADKALLDLHNGKGLQETINDFERMNGLARGIRDSLLSINGKTYSATVVIGTNYHTFGNEVVTEDANDKTPKGYTYNRQTGKMEPYYKNGADFVVPPGFPNDTYPVGYASSGERVVIIPQGMNINMNLPPGSNGAGVYKEFIRTLNTDLRKAKKAGRQYGV